MKSFRWCSATLAVSSAVVAFSLAASSQTIIPLCTPKITANDVVASAYHRYQAGTKAEPPLTDDANGFAWPDTPIGVVKDGTGYAFFGSDGANHARQYWHGKWYGNGKYGSATRVLGTLDDPLGKGSPADVTVRPNPDPSVNPFYGSYDYMGGGPVYRVPQGQVGAGNLIMVYHAEVPTITTQSFYSILGLAASSDDGMSWTDLGEIVRINQAYRTDIDGFDIGDAPLVATPDGKYFYIYFRDWLANGTTHWGSTTTLASVARASVSEVLAAAFGNKPHAAPFQKYYAGKWDLEPGLGGYSTDINPNAGLTGELQVSWDSALQRYVMIVDEGSVLGYAESVDGLQWTSPVTWLYDFRKLPDLPSTYAMPVGEGDDPRILGKEFYVYYTRYPTTGGGWPGASLNRFTLSCP